MYLFMACTSLQLSVINLVLATVSIIVAVCAIVVSYRTNKRYASGMVEVVFKVLDPRLLEGTAKILKQVSTDNCSGNPDLGLYMLGQDNDYGTVWETFFNLNMLVELMLDDALPKKISVVAKDCISKYLSRKHIWAFVDANRTVFPTLIGIKESKDSPS